MDELLNELPDVIDTLIGRGTLSFYTDDDILIEAAGHATIRNVYAESGDMAEVIFIVYLRKNDDGTFAKSVDLLKKEN